MEVEVKVTAVSFNSIEWIRICESGYRLGVAETFNSIEWIREREQHLTVI